MVYGPFTLKVEAAYSSKYVYYLTTSQKTITLIGNVGPHLPREFVEAKARIELIRRSRR
jgi:hypothetical protein